MPCRDKRHNLAPKTDARQVLAVRDLDYVLAHLLVSRAAEQGFSKAVTLQETLEGLMIPEQLAEAQRLEGQGFIVR